MLPSNFIDCLLADAFSRSRVLKQLYSDSSVYRDYDLVVVGHSLGGGCAQVLSLMLRPSFPSLLCFAYEPPVRIDEFNPLFARYAFRSAH